MGKIATYKFFTLFVVSFDLFKEPPHLHIIKEKGNYRNPAKIWLENLTFAETGDLTFLEQNMVRELVKNNLNLFKDSFDALKRGERVKSIKLD